MRPYISFKLARSDVYILIKLFNMIFTLKRSKGRGGWGKNYKNFTKLVVLCIFFKDEYGHFVLAPRRGDVFKNVVQASFLQICVVQKNYGLILRGSGSKISMK